MIEDKKDLNSLSLKWNTYKLEEICVKKGLVRGPFGGALKKEFFVEKGHKVYEQKNAIYKNAEIGNYYIDDVKYEELKRFRLFEGDFIVSCSGTIGKIYRIPKGAESGIINQALLKITLDEEKVDGEFFNQFFEWDNFQNKIIENTQGGAMKNLVGMKIFKNTTITIPSLSEQKKIAEILKTWDEAIELKEQLIKQKNIQKKGLMQNLLTGELRIPGNNDNWEEVRLKDVVKKIKGKKLNYSEEGSIPCIDMEFFETGRFKNYTEHAEVLSSLNDVLLLWDGSRAGRSYTGIEGAVGSTFVKLKCDGIDNWFLHYSLLNDQSKIQRIREGSGIPHVPKDFLNYYKLKIPSIAEQKQISHTIGNFDKSVNLLIKEVDLLRSQKKGLMQLLLTGKVRVGAEG
ncbi:restriction endonuclease subunit S [Salisediminibacterium beveridgei]|uniref:Type I restriction-modification system, specificity subunit S n=1 Tax=Salisediminibacterium beveridgei TaxID=632773 RepID=A0A1D7QSV9_9BACI|nr:restriction endonuclease subunit S [Salisediminibacterium beveridgei]AOM82068.1 Type I restriction-modification system, specificity subunit S [Salisediminibacterium beveridgei]